MAYQFVNNFSQTLAAPLSEAGTTLELDGGGAALAGASPQQAFPLTLIDVADNEEVHREIVYARQVAGEVVTVLRAQEGTVSRAGGWPAGTKIECRLTADTAMLRSGSIILGQLAALESTDAWDVVAIGYAAKVGHPDDNPALGDEGVAIGRFARARGSNTVAIGTGAATSTANASLSVSIGSNSDVRDLGSVGVGDSVLCRGNSATCVGQGARTIGDLSSAYGAYARASGEESTALGAGAQPTTSGVASIGIGRYASPRAAEAISIGYESGHGIPGGIRIVGLPFLPRFFAERWWANPGDGVKDATRQAASTQVISTTDVDLTDLSASAMLEMPAGTLLFVDKIDVVVVSASSAAGNGQIQVGTTAGGSDVIPPTTIATTLPWERQVESPALTQGVSALYISVPAVDTGTELTTRAVFHGYVIEV